MHIKTLVRDIYSTVLRKDGWFSEELANYFAQDVSRRLQIKFNEIREKPRLRISRLGDQCPKALWHSIHTPELAEPTLPWVEIKYSFGHIVEAEALMLAKAAGHNVTGEQDAIVLDGVTGHRDCVIDGCIVDVKSCASPTFSKFQSGKILESDMFGYLVQLDGYVCGSYDDPIVTVKDKGYILAVDKQLGKYHLYEHIIRKDFVRERIRNYQDIVSLSRPPACTCTTVPFGSSGNIALGTRASYSPFKWECFPHLRAFLYSNGPTFLTTVVRKPDVPEIDKYGNLIRR